MCVCGGGGWGVWGGWGERAVLVGSSSRQFSRSSQAASKPPPLPHSKQHTRVQALQSRPNLLHLATAASCHCRLLLRLLCPGSPGEARAVPAVVIRLQQLLPASLPRRLGHSRRALLELRGGCGGGARAGPCRQEDVCTEDEFTTFFWGGGGLLAAEGAAADSINRALVSSPEGRGRWGCSIASSRALREAGSAAQARTTRASACHCSSASPLELPAEQSQRAPMEVGAGRPIECIA